MSWRPKSPAEWLLAFTIALWVVSTGLNFYWQVRLRMAKEELARALIEAAQEQAKR